MTTRYDDDPFGDRYDGPREARTPRWCRGFAEWNGPCGAEDCPSCHPATWRSALLDYDTCSLCGDDVSEGSLTDGRCVACADEDDQ